MAEMPGDSLAMPSRLEPVFSGYPAIVAVYLFGSASRGTESPRSDIDLGLLLADEWPADGLHRFLGEVAARLEAVTAPRPVDLVLLRAQGPVFCHEVVLEGHLVYEGDRERRIDFESDTIVRALDFRPTLEIATRGYLPGFRRWLRSYRDRQ